MKHFAGRLKGHNMCATSSVGSVEEIMMPKSSLQVVQQVNGSQISLFLEKILIKCHRDRISTQMLLTIQS